MAWAQLPAQGKSGGRESWGHLVAAQPYSRQTPPWAPSLQVWKVEAPPETSEPANKNLSFLEPAHAHRLVLLWVSES